MVYTGNSRNVKEVLASHEDYRQSNNTTVYDRHGDLVARLINRIEQLEDENDQAREMVSKLSERMFK